MATDNEIGQGAHVVLPDGRKAWAQPRRTELFPQQYDVTPEGGVMLTRGYSAAQLQIPGPRSMTEIPSRQEMFNRAVRGLASQGFERCYGEGICQYQSGAKRCAWGWVDTTLGPSVRGTVNDLRSDGMGLAALIPYDDVQFARELQQAHDMANRGPCGELEVAATMKRGLQAMMPRFGVTWPEDVPQ